jgi:DNA repair exonuclease SbcCD ATPase subunit
MPTMVREAWTDQRLDDLQKHMDEGFREVKAEIRSLRSEVKGEIESLRSELKGEIQSLRVELRGEIGDLRGEIGELRTSMDAKFDRLTYTLIAALIGLLATHYLG